MEVSAINTKIYGPSELFYRHFIHKNSTLIAFC